MLLPSLSYRRQQLLRRRRTPRPRLVSLGGNKGGASERTHLSASSAKSSCRLNRGRRSGRGTRETSYFYMLYGGSSRRPAGKIAPDCPESCLVVLQQYLLSVIQSGVGKERPAVGGRILTLLSGGVAKDLDASNTTVTGRVFTCGNAGTCREAPDTSCFHKNLPRGCGECSGKHNLVLITTTAVRRANRSVVVTAVATEQCYRQQQCSVECKGLLWLRTQARMLRTFWYGGGAQKRVITGCCISGACLPHV